MLPALLCLLASFLAGSDGDARSASSVRTEDRVGCIAFHVCCVRNVNQYDMCVLWAVGYVGLLGRLAF